MGNPRVSVYRPDNKAVAFGGPISLPNSPSPTGQLTIVDATTGVTSKTIPTSYMVKTLDFSPNGGQVACGGDIFVGGGPSKFEIWSPTTGLKVSSLTSFATGEAASVRYSPDGSVLATAGMHPYTDSRISQGVLELWDPNQAKLIKSLPTKAQGGVVSTAFSPDGKTIFSLGRLGAYGTSNGGLFEAWDVSTGKSLLAPFTGLLTPIAIAVSPDGHTVATAGIRYISKGNYITAGIELWDMDSLTQLAWVPVENLAKDIEAIQFSPDGHKLYASGTGEFFIFDVGSLNLLNSFPVDAGCSVDVTVDDSQILYSSANTQVNVVPNPSPSPIPVSSVTLGASQVLSGSVILGTVTISSKAPASGVVVPVWSNSSLATVPISVIVPEGQTQAQFAVYTGLATKPSLTTIFAGYGASNKSVTLLVNPPSLASVSLNPVTVNGGTSSQLTVKLWAPAPVGGVPISLTSSGAFAKLPASVTVPAGQTSVVVTVTTSSVKQSSTATLTAKLGVYSLSSKLTVQ